MPRAGKEPMAHDPAAAAGKKTPISTRFSLKRRRKSALISRQISCPIQKCIDAEKCSCPSRGGWSRLSKPNASASSAGATALLQDRKSRSLPSIAKAPRVVRYTTFRAYVQSKYGQTPAAATVILPSLCTRGRGGTSLAAGAANTAADVRGERFNPSEITMLELESSSSSEGEDYDDALHGDDGAANPVMAGGAPTPPDRIPEFAATLPMVVGMMHPGYEMDAVPLEVAREISAFRGISPNKAAICSNSKAVLHLPVMSTIAEDVPFTLCFDMPVATKQMAYYWKECYVVLDPPTVRPDNANLHTFCQRIELGKSKKDTKVIFYSIEKAGSTTSYRGELTFRTLSSADILDANGVAFAKGATRHPSASEARDNAIALGQSCLSDAGGAFDLREAAKQFSLAIQFGGNGNVWLQRAQTHQKARMHEEAARDATVALLLANGPREAWSVLASAELELGHFEECIAACESGKLSALLAIAMQAKNRAERKDAKWQQMDLRALNCPDVPEVTRSVVKLAQYLVEPFSDNAEKYRAIFRWITHNIRYDVEALRGGKFGDISAHEMLQKRMGVCSGYSTLFKALCNEVGLECEEVAGYSKGGGYKPGDAITKPAHAWNLIRIEEDWVPLDSCWGAGYVDGGTFTQKFDPFYWCTPPEQFVLTHLPSSQRFSCLNEPPSLATFNTTLKLDGEFFNSGLQLLSHTTAFLEAKRGKTITITFKQMSRNRVNLLAHLKDNKGSTIDGTCKFDPFTRVHSVRIKIPTTHHATTMFLEVFSHAGNSASKSHGCLVRYLISTNGSKGSGKKRIENGQPKGHQHRKQGKRPSAAPASDLKGKIKEPSN